MAQTLDNKDFKTMLDFITDVEKSDKSNALAIVKSVKASLKKTLLAVSHVSFEQVTKQATPKQRTVLGMWCVSVGVCICEHMF